MKCCRFAAKAYFGTSYQVHALNETTKKTDHKRREWELKFVETKVPKSPSNMKQNETKNGNVCNYIESVR